MTALIKYDAACRALAEAKAVDEVKDLRDKADAMRIYAMQAKNKSLEIDAAEIRIRAERRLGELIAAQKDQHGLAAGSRGQLAGKSADGLAVVTNDRQKNDSPTLADAGISKDLSSRAQKIAAVPEDEFEAEVGEWRERVSAENVRVTTRLERAGERATKKPDDMVSRLRARVAELEAELAESREQYEEAMSNMGVMASELEAYKRATDPEHAKKYIQQQGYVDALESQRNDLMNQCAALKREVKALRKRAGEAA